MALMCSLEEGAIEGSIPLPNEDGSEFNAYTLTGENTDLFLALLKFVEKEELVNLNQKDIHDKLRTHLHRGIAFLFVRVKTEIKLLNHCI